MIYFHTITLLIWFAGLLIALPSLATNQINVMTFNLRYASAADGVNNWINTNQSPDRRLVVLRVLQTHQPDIVGFQECEESQLEYLATNFTGYAFEREKPSGGGGNENAAFAWNTNKLNLIDRGVFSLGPAPGGGYWNNTPGTNFDPYVFFPDMGLNFPRIALWGHFEWKSTSQDFLFYTTHYDFNDTPQVLGSHLIANDARSRNDRMPMSPLAVVVGDFNSTHLDHAWKFFTGAYYTNGVTGDFTDSWFQVKGSWNNSGTLHGFGGGIIPENQRIDWIIHRGGFMANSAQIINDSAVATNVSNGSNRNQYPSDHYPVKATLTLPAVPPDYDRDGIPDQTETNVTLTLAVDADTDNDLILDGQEDLNANGLVDGGETDAWTVNDPAHLPTDIRNFQINGIRDFNSSRLAANGLELWATFDGRYLHVASQDAGEGSDHFIFIATNPLSAVNAPWAKAGQVSQWIAFLADENDSAFTGWFDAGKNLITNVFTARAATYYENGGHLEGVIDLGQILPPGFTNLLYLAAAPYGNSDGGALVEFVQVPAGNGDGNILGPMEYFAFQPGDDDGDGINNYADPDLDGDGLPDAWERTYGLTGGSNDDPDGDRSENRHEYQACTNPADSNSVFQIRHVENNTFAHRTPMGKQTTLWRQTASTYNPNGPWTLLGSSTNISTFPYAEVTQHIAAESLYLQFRQSP